MKVTSFHMANKVEEAVHSYFLNSFVFSSRKIDVERTSDFRNNVAVLQFFLHDGDERVPMGGIEFSTIAEQNGKVAIQWKSNVLPADVSNQSFMILSSGQEHYEQYAKLAEVLKKDWEKDVNSYLPKNEEAPPPVQEAPKSVEDEYASLSPEEIEAITGVRPVSENPRPDAAKDDLPVDAASEDEIKRLMGMMVNNPIDAADTSKAAPPMMTEAEIAALAQEVVRQPEDAAAKENVTPPPVRKAEGISDEMSAEEIWKQINGGN